VRAAESEQPVQGVAKAVRTAMWRIALLVLVALLSSMNANVHGASRMACSLVARGQGPKALGKIFGGVPAFLSSSAGRA
jgi:GABA permease